MKKSLLLFAILFLAVSVEFVYSQDTLWTRRYDIPGFIKNAIFSPDDSKILVTGTETFFEVNPQNGEMIREMPELAGRGVRHVAPDKNIGINYSCQLVDLNDYKIIKQIVDTNKYKVPTLFDFAYTNDLTRVAFALKNIIVIDVLSGTEIILEQEFPDFETVLRMDLSPDGRYLALWSYYYELIDEEDLTKNHHYNMIKILDIATNTILKKLSFPSDNKSTGTLKLSPDGSMLAVNRGVSIDMYSVPDLEFVNNFKFMGGGEINGYTFTKNSDNLMTVRPTKIQTFNIQENKLIAENLSPYILGEFIRFANTTDNVLAPNYYKDVYLLSSKITSIKNEDQLTIIHLQPLSNLLILNLSTLQFTNFKIIILNNEGRTVFTQDYISTNEDVSIDVSAYAKGVYFVNIESGNKVLQTYKFIKE